MIVQKINLENFRCHRKYQLNCEEKTTLILGPNGYGKTSILEALFVVLRGKSFRGSDREILRHGAQFYRIEVDFFDGEKRIVTFDGEKKNFYLNNQKFGKLSLKNRYPVVLFEFQDLNLISGSPARKRDFFDTEIIQTNDTYARNLSQYNKALRQHNELLKQNAHPEMFFSWNILLAKFGCMLRRARVKKITEINQKLTKVYRSIAENNDQIKINYETEDELSEKEYLKKLEENLNKDFLFGYTSYGAHRDQYNFVFNQKDAKNSASRGEIRSIMIALKFIEAWEIEKKLGKKPLILLDDVFSELDGKRRKSLVENFKDNQIILTSVEKYKN